MYSHAGCALNNCRRPLFHWEWCGRHLLELRSEQPTQLSGVSRHLEGEVESACAPPKNIAKNENKFQILERIAYPSEPPSVHSFFLSLISSCEFPHRTFTGAARRFLQPMSEHGSSVCCHSGVWDVARKPGSVSCASLLLGTSSFDSNVCGLEHLRLLMNNQEGYFSGQVWIYIWEKAPPPPPLS